MDKKRKKKEVEGLACSMFTTLFFLDEPFSNVFYVLNLG